MAFDSSSCFRIANWKETKIPEPLYVISGLGKKLVAVLEFLLYLSLDNLPDFLEVIVNRCYPLLFLL